MKYSRPRHLSIAISNPDQYLLGHKRGFEDAVLTVQDEISKLQTQNAELRTKLMQVKDWVTKVDPLINGCSIEKEFYELSDTLYRGES